MEPQNTPFPPDSTVKPAGMEARGLLPSPSGPTSLDPDETTSRDIWQCGSFVPLINPQPTDPAHGACQVAFRHSFWRQKRSAILKTMTAHEIPEARISRFQGCGSIAWVLWKGGDHPSAAVVSNRCRDRFCDACQNDRRQVIARNLRKNLPQEPLRFLTLTLKANAEPLADQLKRLSRSFYKFRQRKEIGSRIDGGIYFVEVTRNESTGLWHPHLHAILSGRYLPVELIRKHWLDVTGDSYIVHITLLRDPNEAANYVCKYATKSLNATVWTNEAALSEALSALAGKRLFQPFGSWKELNLSQPPEQGDGWQVVGPLWQVIERASNGDEFALKLLSYLRKADHATFDAHADDP